MSSVGVAAKFTYTYAVGCTFIPGDEARGIACSIEFHHAAIQKLEPRLARTRVLPNDISLVARDSDIDALT